MRYNGSLSLKIGCNRFGVVSITENVHSVDVNNRPRLSLEEEKTCIVLASASTKYEVNRMVKRHYEVFTKYKAFLPLVFFVIPKFIVDSVIVQD
jgi:hypothetical protein